MKIIAVTKNNHILKILEVFLDKYEVTIDLFNTVNRAANSLRQKRHDIIIIDLEFIELAEIARKLYSPSIMLTRITDDVQYDYLLDYMLEEPSYSDLVKLIQESYKRMVGKCKDRKNDKPFPSSN